MKSWGPCPLPLTLDGLCDSMTGVMLDQFLSPGFKRLHFLSRGILALGEASYCVKILIPLRPSCVEIIFQTPASTHFSPNANHTSEGTLLQRFELQHMPHTEEPRPQAYGSG